MKPKGIEAVGKAEGIAIEARGMATAEAYEKQKQAIGQEGVIAVSVAEKIAGGNVKIVPTRWSPVAMEIPAWGR